jgi:hypothetical protein
LGNIEHESFIEGKIQSLAVTKQGDLFMTKQMKSVLDNNKNDSGMDESIIWRFLFLFNFLIIIKISC